LVDPSGREPKEDRPSQPVDPRGLPVDPGDAQAGAITHDVNNLLTAILGHAEIALADPDLPASARADLLEVVRATRQAALLTRQLVALRRPSLPDRALIDLRGVATTMARMLGPLLGESIELRAKTGSRPVLVRASPTDLEGVILNLAINARDAMPSGGVLTIATAILPGAGGRRAALTVGDSGTGMDPLTRARAFEPYFTTKGPGRGSGLGLASVAATVERSGWTMLVETTPGAGSRFTVTIPLAHRANEDAPDPRLGSAARDRTVAPVAAAATEPGDAPG
jgi:two-component system cell cycle sensor histidine kinase/response regulator CckA